MSEQTICDFEPAVVKSLKSGFINGEIGEHIQSCSNCRETAKVVRFFQTNLIKESPPKNLPVAGLIWWKSKLRERRRAAENVSRPILLTQTAAVVVAFGTFIWLWLNGSLQFSFLETALNRVFNSMEIIAVPFVIGLICFTIICTTLIFALRLFMTEK